MDDELKHEIKYHERRLSPKSMQERRNGTTEKLVEAIRIPKEFLCRVAIQVISKMLWLCFAIY
jgi:hypothetical protein